MAPKKSRKKGKSSGVAKSKRRQPQGDEVPSADSTAADVKARDEVESWQLYELAKKYGLGEGVEQSDEEAARYCRKAAEKGLKEAQCNLGYCYSRGQGVPQDFVEAARWYRRASNQGVIEAHDNLAVLYRNGKGVAQDFEESARLFRLAADAGRADGQFNLGCQCRDGKGMKQDFAEAARWFQLAAAQEHVEAQCALGILFLYGRGVPLDFVEGRRLMELAAAQGDAAALLNLGLIYEKGAGVEKNVALAKQYYRRAGKLEPEVAIDGKTTEHFMNQHLDGIKHTCATCETVGDDLKVCTRCKGPRYCGVACQKKDWPEHKRVCQRLAKTEDSDRMAQDANDY